MRPSILHLSILLALTLPGVVLFLFEASSGDPRGMIFPRHGVTQLYGLALLIYAVVSSVIAASVYLVLRIKNRAFTNFAVVLSHLVPIALVWTTIELGLHDALEDAWKAGSGIIRPQARRETPARRPELSAAPLRAARSQMPTAGPGVAPVPNETLEPGGEERQARPKDEF